MAASSCSKDKFFDNVINPYLREVMQHPQAIQMCDGVLHIRDVQGHKGTESVEAKIEAIVGALKPGVPSVPDLCKGAKSPYP
ncbi:40S ribosomal protein S5-1 [Hordeum vulgare]|nr:40S ribosomal protein S5-1 [Hordeum vulgare]